MKTLLFPFLLLFALSVRAEDLRISTEQIPEFGRFIIGSEPLPIDWRAVQRMAEGFQLLSDMVDSKGGLRSDYKTAEFVSLMISVIEMADFLYSVPAYSMPEAPITTMVAEDLLETMKGIAAGKVPISHLAFPPLDASERARLSEETKTGVIGPLISKVDAAIVATLTSAEAQRLSLISVQLFDKVSASYVRQRSLACRRDLDNSFARSRNLTGMIVKARLAAFKSNRLNIQPSIREFLEK